MLAGKRDPNFTLNPDPNCEEPSAWLGCVCMILVGCGALAGGVYLLVFGILQLDEFHAMVRQRKPDTTEAEAFRIYDEALALSEQVLLAAPQTHDYCRSGPSAHLAC